MKRFKWQEGRQHSGYSKMLLMKSAALIPFDLWLLKYPEGARIDWHRDPVDEGKHFRLNILLKKAKLGGEFLSKGRPLFNIGRVVLFRPDRNLHKVNEIKEGTRYVLSLGWLWKT